MESDISEKQDSPFEKFTQIEIELRFGTNSSVETELILNITEPHLSYNFSGEVLLSPLVSYLISLGYPLENAIIWYFSPTARLNVYCGSHPVPFSIAIPLFELRDGSLLLICRGIAKNEFGPTLNMVSHADTRMKQEHDNFNNHSASRRTKERKIGYIIDKVSKWRRLYNGITDENGDFVKMTLENAANKVKISKKSLDDYLLQLRIAKRFGFNFQEHRDDKVGILRAYVKKFKNLQVYAAMIDKGEKIPDEIISALREPGTSACKSNRCCAPGFALAFKQENNLISSKFLGYLKVYHFNKNSPIRASRGPDSRLN
ncbi:unnamed protein product [Blepharisma stoltei]|uniref:Uncharacterized protein n=1 Tax=Blepharisma stoltei TaxID=1481888 RepID=A0AAU9ISG8_9CILI|nr:unnamed protein product [Blepharisma stoltei]